MKITNIGLAAAAFAALTAPAFANTTSVACPGYVIAMSDEVAIRGEALAGSYSAFERVVCERSTDAADLDTITARPVFIEELGVTTRVVIFPIDVK